MNIRSLGLFAAFLLALAPAPAQAQGDFIKDTVRNLILKSGIYVSTGTRTSIDDDVDMGPSWGIGYGSAGSKRTGWKYPFSFSSYRGDLETSTNSHFGEFKAQQIMSGVGYQWVRGKMVYGAQLGVGYSFNKVAAKGGAAEFFGSSGPVVLDVGNSFVVRPQVKAEYFVIPKVSLRTQFSYCYTDPHVTVQTPTERFREQWNPHHLQLSFAVGFFPFRK